ncbi:hypothetical protein EDC96DRAFT_569166 [Choanephora cucurbitarum]|nr:hypothetical protein EDC96DRAFT_569166 [Choanephora cucurbitarum]
MDPVATFFEQRRKGGDGDGGRGGGGGGGDRGSGDRGSGDRGSGDRGSGDRGSGDRGSGDRGSGDGGGEIDVVNHVEDTYNHDMQPNKNNTTFTQNQVKSQAIPMHANPTYVGYYRSLRTKGGKKIIFHSLGAPLSHCQEMSTLILSILLNQTPLDQTPLDQTPSDRATTVAVGMISVSISCSHLDRNADESRFALSIQEPTLLVVTVTTHACLCASPEKASCSEPDSARNRT